MWLGGKACFQVKPSPSVVFIRVDIVTGINTFGCWHQHCCLCPHRSPGPWSNCHRAYQVCIWLVSLGQDRSSLIAFAVSWPPASSGADNAGIPHWWGGGVAFALWLRLADSRRGWSCWPPWVSGLGTLFRGLPHHSYSTLFQGLRFFPSTAHTVSHQRWSNIHRIFSSWKLGLRYILSPLALLTLFGLLHFLLAFSSGWFCVVLSCSFSCKGNRNSLEENTNRTVPLQNLISHVLCYSHVIVPPLLVSSSPLILAYVM